MNEHQEKEEASKKEAKKFKEFLDPEKSRFFLVPVGIFAFKRGSEMRRCWVSEARTFQSIKK